MIPISVLIVLALDAWLWWRYDWHVGVAGLAACFVSYILGHLMLRKQLEAEGYALEYKPNAAGKKRWRVGVKKVQREADIQWVPPASG